MKQDALVKPTGDKQQFVQRRKRKSGRGRFVRGKAGHAISARNIPSGDSAAIVAGHHKTALKRREARGVEITVGYFESGRGRVCCSIQNVSSHDHHQLAPDDQFRKPFQSV